MLEVIESGTIGKVEIVQATFGFHTPEAVDRLVKKELGGGALLDIGCYALNVALMAFGQERPEKVGARPRRPSDGRVCFSKHKDGLPHTHRA